jgi:hypothetical protein
MSLEAAGMRDALAAPPPSVVLTVGAFTLSSFALRSKFAPPDGRPERLGAGLDGYT